MRESANENKKRLSRCGAAVLKTQSENKEVLGNNLICNSLSNDRSSFFAKFCKKEAKSLEDNDNMLIFAARMRVAYRRDGIKLRNRSFIQSRRSSTCGFSF